MSPVGAAAGLLDQAVADRLVPGAVLAAGGPAAGSDLWHVVGDAQCGGDDHAGGQGRREVDRPMTADTVFDLASLTKVVATTPALLQLMELGHVGLDDVVQRYLPGFSGAGKDRVTVRQLLSHTSGLPDHRPYFETLTVAEEVRTAALTEPLVASPGTVFCYSDIGFICLGELVTAVSGAGLDELVEEVVCRPLGMTSTRYRPPAEWADRVASTEIVEGVAKTGVVHDENAETLGGVAGHAGLFGTAADLVRYARSWLSDDDAVLSPALRAEALRCQTSGLRGRRGLGWGLRGDPWDNMGQLWPSSGVGHTGFTGTCLSLDPGSGLWMVLLTNAVHFGRGPEHSTVALRRRMHDRVAEALLPALS